MSDIKAVTFDVVTSLLVTKIKSDGTFRPNIKSWHRHSGDFALHTFKTSDRGLIE